MLVYNNTCQSQKLLITTDRVAMSTLIWRFSEFNTQNSNTSPQLRKTGLQDLRKGAHHSTLTSQKTTLILRASPDNFI